MPRRLLMRIRRAGAPLASTRCAIRAAARFILTGAALLPSQHAAAQPATGDAAMQAAPSAVPSALPSIAAPVQTEPGTPRGRPYSIEPYAALTETYTDNVNLTPKKQSDLITQPSVGIRAAANSARLKGYLDYALTGLWYARGNASSQLQQYLNAVGNAAVVENFFNVDATGNISQQSISAFGPPSPDTSLHNANQTTVSTFGVSPYLHGRLGGEVDYEARLRYADTRSSDAALANYTLSAQSLSLGNTKVARKLNGSVQLQRTVIDYREGRRTEDDLLRGMLNWNATPEFMVSAIGGTEATNYVSDDKERHTIYGAAVKWAPSPRTNLLVDVEKRFFGNSHNIAFTHRTARTVWAFTDVRDVSTNTQPAFGSLGTAYDLFFQQFASVQPDPVLRRQMVVNFLQANGIDPNALAIARFLNSAVTLQRMQNLSFAWLGLRDTVTFSASQSWQQQLNTLTGVGGALATATELHQRGLLASVSHRLTPISTLAVIYSIQRTTGVTAAEASTLRMLSTLYTTKIGPRADLSFGVRRAVFGSPTTPYNESAIFGTFRYQF